MNWFYVSTSQTVQSLGRIRLCDPMDCSTPGFPVHHQLPELTPNGEEPTCQSRRRKRLGFDPWVGELPWRRKWQPTPVLLPGESHGQGSLGGLQSIGSHRVGHDWSNWAHNQNTCLQHDLAVTFLGRYLKISIFEDFRFEMWHACNKMPKAY